MSDERKSDREDRTTRWLRENAEKIDAANAWVEANGLPLAGQSAMRQWRGKLHWSGDQDEIHRELCAIIHC